MSRHLDDLKNKKFFKVKKANKNFLCPLCSAPRQMRYSKQLNEKQFIQIFVLSAFLSWAFFPIMGLKALTLIFLVWIGFEVVNKLLYRKEIPCPYCGFDATWYRRDVKVARKLVDQFWADKKPVKMEVSKNIPKPRATTAQIKKPTFSDDLEIPKLNPEVFKQDHPEKAIKDNIGSSF